MTSSTMEIFDEEVKIKNILSLDECEISRSSVQTITKCYNMMMNGSDYNEIYNFLLSQIIYLTESNIGGICNLKYDKKDSFLDFVAMDSINEVIKFDKIRFHSTELNNLIGKSIIKMIIIISNNYEIDPRKSIFLPKDHFPIKRLLVIPLIINDYVIGMIMLANKHINYTENDIYKIYSLIKICSDTIFHNFFKKTYNITDIIQEKSQLQQKKDSFLAIMSHELRTPLTSIIGFIELLPQCGSLNAKQMEYLKIATVSSVQLLDLLNSILDFSRLTSHTLILAAEPINIRKCVEESIKIGHIRATGKKLTIKSHIDDNIPQLIIGDNKRLIQLIVNLLTNAIKFTNEGTIMINVSGIKNIEIMSRWKIIFEIRDTGIGMNDSIKDNLFKPFFQVGCAYDKNDGVGLGLTISKELVSLMGGDIKAYSDGLGRGSTFSFYINVEEDIDIDEYMKKYEADFKQINIISVDDKNDNLLLLDDMLTRWKIKNIMCINAEQALKYLKRDEFNIAIIDIFMPHMSGIELAQKIRELYPKISLIGISSVGNCQQGEQFFDVYLHKPYNQSAILQGILYCISLNRQNNETTIPPMIKNRKILKNDVKIIIDE